MKKNTLYFSLEGNEYPIVIKHNKRQKHIRLRINSDGRINVSAPAGTSNKRIQEVLKCKQSWLTSKLDLTNRELEKINPLKRVYIDGMPYSVRFECAERPTYHLEVDYAAQTVVIYGRKKSRLETTGILEKWLRKEARQRLVRYAEQVSNETGISYKKLFLRNQKTRWGSSSTLGNISLNWRTIMAPREVQRYLIIHELVHQQFMNHSPDFWNRVVHYCPDYAHHEAWLKQNRALMGLFRNQKH